MMRIGAVSYLNTRPLIHGLEQFAPWAELVLDVPSRLADRLARGDLDVALIPSIEAFRSEEYRIVSDACIACRGPVLSVQLLSRVPIPAIETLALDAGSRTSVALVQILLQRRFGVSPTLQSLALDRCPTAETVEADAVLVIGDRAIHASRLGFAQQWDLGDQWCRWTGLPFVFAMWTARRTLDTHALETALRQARDAGVAQLERIAAREAPAAGLDEQACLSYLRDNLHFTLGTREQQGLELFLSYARQLGFVSPSHTKVDSKQVET